MKINDISQKNNQNTLTHKDNTDFGFKDVVKDLKKAKHDLDNLESKPQIEKKFEQDWIPTAMRIPVIKTETKIQSAFADIVKDAVNISSSDINSLIYDITSDETGERIDVEDLEFCLDLFIEISGKEL